MLAEQEARRLAEWAEFMPQLSSPSPGSFVRLDGLRFERQGRAGMIRTAEPGHFLIATNYHQRHYDDGSRLTLAGQAGGFIPARLTHPNGLVECRDGSTLILSFDDLPLYWIARSGEVQPIAPWTPVPRRGRRWYIWTNAGVSWKSQAGQRRSQALLDEYGIQELPMLVDVLPVMAGNVMPIVRAVEFLEEYGSAEAASAAARSLYGDEEAR